jgi:hypothetical protein
MLINSQTQQQKKGDVNIVDQCYSKVKLPCAGQGDQGT